MTATGRVMGRRLHAAGVRHVMGHPGGEVVELIDALRMEGLEFVLTRHEAAAAFMAAAMGELTGVPGVCLATLGPGATNLVTGVAHAWLDRAPLIAITGQLPVDRYESATHQKLDLRALFAPITKWQARVTPANAASVVARALREATRQRAGPVFLEVPSDVARQQAADEDAAPVIAAAAARPDEDAAAAAAAHPDEDAAALLRASRRPLLFVGMDAREAAAVEPLRRLAEDWGVPVLAGPKAKGTFREDHPLFLGTIEGLGTDALFALVERSDLVLMAGFDPVEFDRAWDFAVDVVHLGPLPNDDRYYPSRVEITAPVAEGIAALLRAAGSPEPRWDADVVRRTREGFLARLRPRCAGLAAQDVLAALRKVLPEDALLTCDVGYNKAVATQCWPAYRPRTFFVSNGLSSMGFGLPAALGLKLARPELPVACVVGDGGFAMVAAELETAVRRELAVLVVVLVDGALSQIKAGQERRGLTVTGTTFSPVDHVALARALGAEACAVETAAVCADAFRWALGTGRPTLVAARVDPDCYRVA